MTDHLSPEEAWELIGHALNCTEHTHCATERKIIVERFFNYPPIEAAAQKVIQCWESGDLAGAVRGLDAVIKNPFTGYIYD